MYNNPAQCFTPFQHFARKDIFIVSEAAEAGGGGGGIVGPSDSFTSASSVNLDKDDILLDWLNII